MEKKSANDVRLFQSPIHGLVNGKSVRILAVGDVPGNSPSYLTVNGQGQSEWKSFAEVTIIDTNCLPLSTEAAQSFQHETTGASRR
jgi:hypothetical protein